MTRKMFFHHVTSSLRRTAACGPTCQEVTTILRWPKVWDVCVWGCRIYMFVFVCVCVRLCFVPHFVSIGSPLTLAWPRVVDGVWVGERGEGRGVGCQQISRLMSGSDCWCQAWPHDEPTKGCLWAVLGTRYPELYTGTQQLQTPACMFTVTFFTLCDTKSPKTCFMSNQTICLYVLCFFGIFKSVTQCFFPPLPAMSLTTEGKVRLLQTKEAEVLTWISSNKSSEKSGLRKKVQGK